MSEVIVRQVRGHAGAQRHHQQAGRCHDHEAAVSRPRRRGTTGDSAAAVGGVAVDGGAARSPRVAG